MGIEENDNGQGNRSMVNWWYKIYLRTNYLFNFLNIL